ncbi:MAG: IS66 family insertion sequence element accessory protein TnpB [Bacteroidaceae bacterium]
MLDLTQSMRYFLCSGITDMRKSFYTLSSLVLEKMGQDVRSGDVFLFINKRKNQIKILHAEPNGLVLYSKKLYSGKFSMPKYDETTKSYPMVWDTLNLILAGQTEDEDSRYNRLKKLEKTNLFYQR